MGRLCRELELIPELILSSDSIRTTETVQLFSSACEAEIETRFLPELYHASPSRLLDAASTAGRTRRLMLVAHNPGLEELAERLSGEHQRFPTGSLAAFDLDIEQWNTTPSSKNSRLHGIWRPRELED